jgi:DnaJ-class molecular chaperone
VKDPYEVLGLARTATVDEIRKAYRGLARTLHPDLNPGNKDAEARFKEASAAYDLLSDPDKRRRFDSGEIDASGQERPQQQYYREYASSGGDGSPYANASGFADFAGSGDAEDIFSELFRRSAQGRRRRGADLHFRLPIDFLDAVNGATRRVTLPEGGALDVVIPPGVESGEILRLRGKGASPRGEGDPGDALVELTVNPHRHFVRDGDDIRIELPVTLSEAALGGRVRAPTPTGDVMLTIPKGSNTGATLRLKGKGAPRRGGREGRGDEFVEIKVMLPPEPDPELEKFLADWSMRKSYDPRKDMQS